MSLDTLCSLIRQKRLLFFKYLHYNNNNNPPQDQGFMRVDDGSECLSEVGILTHKGLTCVFAQDDFGGKTMGK